jgi:hypothetical protein
MDFLAFREQDANKSAPDYVHRSQATGILGYFLCQQKVSGARSIKLLKSMNNLRIKPLRSKKVRAPVLVKL